MISNFRLFTIRLTTLTGVLSLVLSQSQILYAGTVQTLPSKLVTLNPSNQEIQCRRPTDPSVKDYFEGKIRVYGVQIAPYSLEFPAGDGFFKQIKILSGTARVGSRTIAFRMDHVVSPRILFITPSVIEAIEAIEMGPYWISANEKISNSFISIRDPRDAERKCFKGCGSPPDYFRYWDVRNNKKAYLFSDCRYVGSFK